MNDNVIASTGQTRADEATKEIYETLQNVRFNRIYQG
jgi:hypothetical protein